MNERTPLTIAEFTDQMHEHHEHHDERLYAALPDNIADQITQTGQAVRSNLELSWANLAVFFGEQPYGPGPQKVLGKRLLGRAAQLYSGAATVELMATWDAIGSEPNLRTYTLPNAQSKEGFLNVNLLPGWKKIAYRAIAATPSPTVAQLQTMRRSVSSLYNRNEAEAFLDRIETTYTTYPASYGDANTAILRDYETTLGIEGDRLVHDAYLDTFIAERGGLETLLKLWPKFIDAARNYAVEGVRIPADQEAPFYLYHDDCGSRMTVTMDSQDSTVLDMETALAIKCMHCDHQENLTPADIITEHRMLAFRAMARVAAYSLFKVADGQVTGGGSIYNRPTQGAMDQLGLPYWPMMHMSKTNKKGRHTGIFAYQSSAANKKKASTMPGYTLMNDMVQQGQMSMADLEISTNPLIVRNAIDETLKNPGAFSSHSRIIIPKSGRNRKHD